MSSAEESIVEEANSSFYEAYKRGALEFLSFVRQIGEDGLRSGQLLPGDLDAVKKGLNALDREGNELFPLLAKVIDETKPGFWDECVVQNIWQLLGGVFLIAQHSGINRSAKAYVAKKQTQPARKAKSISDVEKARRQKEALRIVLNVTDFSEPYKLAGSIYSFNKERAKLDRVTKKLDIKLFSRSTAERLLVEMRKEAKSAALTTVSDEGSL